MRLIFRRALLIVMVLIMLTPLCSAVGSAKKTSDLPAEMIRVGLCYGIGAKHEIQLDTNANLGYRIGFYDDGRTLHAIGVIPQRSVIVAPDLSASLSVGDVGGFHLRLPAVFETFDEASDNAGKNGGFPAFCNGEFCVMVGSYPTLEAATDALSSLGREADVYADSGRGVLVFSTDEATPLFLFDYSSTHALVLSPYDTDFKPATACAGNQYRGDFQFNRLSSEVLTVVNCVALEDYVKGVVPNEMSASWPTEALKAQAVCARTYALKNLNSYRVYGFDVANDTTSQVYRGLRDADETTDAACEATAGEVLRYNGELCAVYYFAADGGATESSEYVWNDVAIPYLRSVADPYEAEVDFYCKSWSASASRAYLGELFIDYAESGLVRSVSFGDRNYQGDDVRDFLVLVGAPYNSRAFSVSYQEDSDQYVISGKGFGHNLGMSQWGAYAMAQNHDMTYQDILSFYFSGATVS